MTQRRTGLEGKAPTCPYCGNRAVLVTSTAHLFRGIERGPHWICTPCGARVGCHPGSTVPLGVPANLPLRLARRQAHVLFDALWKGVCRAHKSSYFRVVAYRWLARELGIRFHECHIGRFDLGQCERVIAICSDPLKIEVLRAKFPHSNVETDVRWNVPEREKKARRRRLRSRGK